MFEHIDNNLKGEIKGAQLLNDMLRDFSYRTTVKIVDFLDGKQLFNGTVSMYHKSDLKKRNLYVDVAEVFDGEFIINVR